MPIPAPPTPAAIAARLRAVLPGRWFADDAPVLGAVLDGLAATWHGLFTLLDAVRAQTRIATATGQALDMVALDFFGARLTRRLAQGDVAFRAAIRRELLRSRATRPALAAMLAELSPLPARIFEPTRPADTGAWNLATGWGAAGGWGSLALPYQCFVDIAAPPGTGIATVAGWNGGAGWGGGPAAGPLEYATLEMLLGQLTAAEIQQSIAAVLPASAIAWVRIST